jgi:serine/threonine protein kinase/tetratricopeptide (TPR) repeat protein
MIGRTISHFSIVEQIGEGGMGVVYRAHDERLGREVALKVLAPGRTHDQSFIDRFSREARLLSKLNHPNIATVHDFDTVEGTSFLVMELIHGQTLDRKVKTRPQPESEVLRLGVQLLQGLLAAHEAGIIHRDLKPSNLRETPDGRLKILDFGLARIVQSDFDVTQSNTSTGGIVGTLPYMSPEQLQGDSLDARTDIYSAGAVLFEMATGRRPFTETPTSSLIEAILRRPAASPREFNPEISADLEAIILKALEKLPQRRYQTAREMLLALQRLSGTATKITEPRQPAAPEPSQAPPMEIAHVLFAQIVGYANLPMDEQQRQLRTLQSFVRETAEFERARSRDQLISIPASDGMALVFFGDPEAPVRCAVELSAKDRQQPTIKLRMGINSGPVYRLADINANRNVSGEGINVAQCVMECGDSGHILVSKTVADVLKQISRWQGQLQDMGEVPSQAGTPLHLFNLSTEQFGNAALPEKLKMKTAVAPRPAVNWKPYAMGLAAVLLLGVLAGVVLHHYQQQTQVGVVKPSRPKLAVIGFKNLSNRPEANWMSSTLSEMLTHDMEAGDHLVATAGEEVAVAKRDLSLGDEASFGPETVQRIRHRLHCDYLLYGSFYAPGKDAGNTVKVMVRLQDGKSGEILASFTEDGSEAQLDEVTGRLGTELREKLQIPSVSPSESDEIQAAIPSTRSREDFYQGLDRLRNFDFLSASDLLQKASKSDPNFALAHAYLAEAWIGLGYDDRAREEARKAFDLSKHLSREDQHLVEARYREMNAEWDKAAELYQSLWTFYPEKSEYALSAADVLIRAGKGNDALTKIQSLRDGGGPIAKDPRLDLKQAEAHASLGNWAQGRDAANSAANLAQERSARLLQAEALWQACADMANLSDATGAQKSCEQSMATAKAVGDLMLVARGLSVLGNVAAAQGNFERALECHREALENARKIGSRRDITGALTNIGNVFSSQGDHAAAQKSYREGLAEAKEINDKGQELTLLNNLAGESQMTGDFKAALQLYEQSLQTARAIQDKAGTARALNNMGYLYALQGNFQAALPNIDAAIKGSKETGQKGDEVGFLYTLGDTKLAQGDLALAEENYQAGTDLATQIGDKMNVALGQLSLGVLRLQQGRPADAIVLGKQAVDEFHSDGMKDLEIQARNLIASCLIALDRKGEAAPELETIKKLEPQDPAVKLAVAITAARLQFRTEKGSQAGKQLEVVETEAKRMGVPSLQFEARLAQGEMGLFDGNKQKAQLVLTNLEQEASRKGYKQFASRAKEVARQIGAARG